MLLAIRCYALPPVARHLRSPRHRLLLLTGRADSLRFKAHRCTRPVGLLAANASSAPRRLGRPRQGRRRPSHAAPATIRDCTAATPCRPQPPAAAARIAAMGFAGSGGWLCRSILLQGIPPPSAPHNASNSRGSSAHEPRTVAGTTARSSFAHGLPPPSNCRRRRTRAVPSAARR